MLLPIARKFLGLFLSFSLVVVACLVGCLQPALAQTSYQTPHEKSAQRDAVQDTISVAPFSGPHSCHETDDDLSDPPQGKQPSPPQTITCCPLYAEILDAAAKIPALSSLTIPSLLPVDALPPGARPLRSLIAYPVAGNHGRETYLRIRVLLI